MDDVASHHDEFERSRLSDRECYELFERLFPAGFAGEDVLEELAASGWRPPTRAAAEGASMETAELVALCLWDVFSENHDVLAPDGRVADLGSWRGSAGFLADLVNVQTRTRRFDYMDFYMGTSMFRRGPRAMDLMRVYVLIFRRLRACDFDWRYRFPQIHLVDLRPLACGPDMGDEAKPEWEDYSPSEAFADEAQHRKVVEDVERGNREAIEAARERPPPATVRAYREVYGRFPEGWPPWEE